MFGVDLGITVSSVTCMTEKNQVLDFDILFGNTKQKDDWIRITEMAEAICDCIFNICKGQPDVVIEQLVSIEEPVLPWKVRNPRSYFQLSCLYALVRNKLQKRGFSVYSVNPNSAKSTARFMGFKNGKIADTKLANKQGKLTKYGMVKAYKKVTGMNPPYHTIVGKETLADSFFIARTGLDRRKIGIN